MVEVCNSMCDTNAGYYVHTVEPQKIYYYSLNSWSVIYLSIHGIKNKWSPFFFRTNRVVMEREKTSISALIFWSFE
jgi:hypothetical protein